MLFARILYLIGSLLVVVFSTGPMYWAGICFLIGTLCTIIEENEK